MIDDVSIASIKQYAIIHIWRDTQHPPENTNIDRGNSRGQYWYSKVNMNVISNKSIVNNYLII